MRRQVLFNTETTSEPFSIRSPGAKILLSGHAGGVWVLQMKDPKGRWLDTDVTFSEDRGDNILPFHEEMHRLTGGTAGAEAWIYD